MMYRIALLLLACPAVVIATPSDDAFFETKIRPVLAGTCFKCHGGDKVSAKLRVDGREALIKGGETGPAIVPGNPEKSALILAIRRVDEDTAMPPNKKQALPAATVKDFEAWIKAGAPWPAKAAPLQGEKHWAFEPVAKVQPPGDGKANLVDAFLSAKLAERKITPAGRADKRILIRRATFDLTGLPPTPEEAAAFLADDSADAFSKVLDRLLASPRYGERWGRHWLDVVRYADTAGETADFPVPHAWRYRNYVINAFNADKPYDQFLREQIAGDIIAAKDPNISTERYAELVTATGYIAIARRFGFDIEKDHFLTVDDTIDTLGKSILGLAIGCARCHDHKYDPISAADYYALYGIFDSTRYPYSGCEKTPRSRDMMTLAPAAEIARSVQPFKQQLAAMDESIRKLSDAHAKIAGELKREHAEATRGIAKGQIDENGKQAFAGPNANGLPPLERVAVKKGQMIQLVITPRTNYGGDSTRIEFKISEVGGKSQVWDVTQDVLGDFLAGNPHADRMGNAAVWCFLDPRTGPVLIPEPLRDFQGKKGLHIWRSGDTPSVFLNASEAAISAWTSLPPRSFFAHPAADGPVTIGWISPIDGEVSVAGEVADAHPNNGDGIAWSIEYVALDVAASFAKVGDGMKAIVEAKRKRDEFARSEPRLPVAYAVTEGKPHHVPIFVRGDPETRGEIVPRRFLSHFGGQPVPDDAGSGRLLLAGWLTARENPLTSRVMVNRIWQHHFGRGIVRTSSDFGLRGLAPSHPELLDYLAARFADEKWSMKAMHRLIMMSDAYQRADSAADPSAASTDASNTLLWRFDRRRLSAEEIRDSILAVSGDLDLTPAEGHAFPAENTWGFTQHTPFAAVYDHNRRSVYLMTQRIKRHPFLTLFDGPDANASTDQRHSSTMPTQALFFLNDPFVHAKATSLATRLLAMPDDAKRLDQLFRAMYGRAPSEREAAQALAFIARYAKELTDVPEANRAKTAWAAWVRVMFGSNEFLYVD